MKSVVVAENIEKPLNLPEDCNPANQTNLRKRIRGPTTLKYHMKITLNQWVLCMHNTSAIRQSVLITVQEIQSQALLIQQTVHGASSPHC